MVIIRRARAEDKDEVMSWVKDIWGGRDYIPHVWDKWIKDPNGALFVAEDEDKVVAVWHIRWIDKEIAWFEGMRVRPEYRNKGIATKATAYSLALSKFHGYKWAMLSTTSKNIAARRIAEKLGFKPVSKFYDFSLSGLKNYRGRTPKIIHKVGWDILMRYNRLRANNAIIGHELGPWVFKQLTKDEFAKIVSTGSMLMTSDNMAIAILGGVYIYRGEQGFYIRYLDALKVDSLRKIIRNIIRRALKEGVDNIYGFIPCDQKLVYDLKSLGVKVNDKREILVYQCNLEHFKL